MKYSVIVPLKNEGENIIELIEEIEPVMNSLNESWELICINDGSTDNSAALLDQLLQSKKNLRVITFLKNYGQSSAFDAGFKAALGEFVITLDGDRQNDPKDILTLISSLDNSDLVCGQRTHRKDSLIKRITSKVANFVRGRICQDGVKDTGCSLKIYRKSALQKIKMYEGMHRFLPALFKIEGFQVKEVPVNHRERVKGKSNYHLWNRSFNTIADMFAVMWMRKRKLHYKIKEVSSNEQ